MDIIEMARELGKMIQKEESYINLHKAQEKADADMDLQQLIGEFNLKRLAINNEASKADNDQEKMQALNQEMRAVYAKIMQNENMIAYNDAKDAFDALYNRVSAIITNSANGEDPKTTDVTSGCTGSCSTCGGCH
ncbi:MAG: YlbF family regulator [bacterium]|nr:YlbF family regulator [bacterium]